MCRGGGVSLTVMCGPKAMVLLLNSMSDARTHMSSSGTVTMLMVKSDKRSKVFREQISLLKEYSKLHDLPEVRPAGSITCLGGVRAD